MKGQSLFPMKGKFQGQSQKGRHLCADIFGLSRQENSCSLRRSGRRPPTQGPNKAKRSGERWRCCLPVPVCVCLSSCLGLGLSGLCSAGVCPVRWGVFLLFPGRLFLVGTVPKTGHAISGIPSPRLRFRGRFYLVFMAVTYGAASLLIIVDLSLLSTFWRLMSRARGSCVSSTFVHVVEATILPAVAAQANSGRLTHSFFKPNVRFLPREKKSMKAQVSGERPRGQYSIFCLFVPRSSAGSIINH